MNSEPSGRYGDTGEDATRCRPNSDSPKGIVRMRTLDETNRLARLLRPTSCTFCKIYYEGAEPVAKFLFGKGDRVAAATEILTRLGYRVHAMHRL